MTMTDPVADTLARMRNALMRRHLQVDCLCSRFIERILKVFQEEGYIESFEKVVGDSGHPVLRVFLRYHSGKGVIQKMWRVSKPGLRVYAPADKVGKVAGGWGIYVVSTSRGVLSSNVALREGLGGEVICAVL